MDIAKEAKVALGTAVTVTGALGVLAGYDYDLTGSLTAKQLSYRFERWHAVMGVVLALLVLYLRNAQA